jgi:hypothetical protein
MMPLIYFGTFEILGHILVEMRNFLDVDIICDIHFITVERIDADILTVWRIIWTLPRRLCGWSWWSLGASVSVCYNARRRPPWWQWAFESYLLLVWLRIVWFLRFPYGKLISHQILLRRFNDEFRRTFGVLRFLVCKLRCTIVLASGRFLFSFDDAFKLSLVAFVFLWIGLSIKYFGFHSFIHLLQTLMNLMFLKCLSLINRFSRFSQASSSGSDRKIESKNKCDLLYYFLGGFALEKIWF